MAKIFICPAPIRPRAIHNGFGEYISNLGLKQLRIAETEKYAHVTYFFSGGKEQPYPGEDRILVPSPKVATYDLQPEMSAFEVTDKLEAAILSRQYHAIICNYANGDMVGHSGNMAAATKAIEALDSCIGRAVKAMQSIGGEVIITADHGNAEQMLDRATHQAHTAHTLNPVPFLYIGRKAKLAEHGCTARPRTQPAVHDGPAATGGNDWTQLDSDYSAIHACYHARHSGNASVISLYVLLCASVSASPAYAGQQEELENLRQRISRDAARNGQNQRVEIRSRRCVARIRTGDQRQQSQTCRTLRTATRSRWQSSTNCKRRQQQLTDSMAGQQVLLGKLLYQQYLGGKQEYLKLILNNQDPNQVARDLQYYQYIARNRAAWLTTLRNDLDRAEYGQRGNTRHNAAKLDPCAPNRAAQKKTLEKDQRARQQVLGKISLQLRQQRREINRLQRDENRLAQLVDKFTKMLAQPKSKSLFRNDNLPDNRFDGSPFETAQGQTDIAGQRRDHQPLRHAAPR